METIKNFEEYINEDYFSKLASRKDNGNVRKEKENAELKSILNDIKNQKINFVPMENKYNENNSFDVSYESLLISISDIQYLIDLLPSGYRVMTCDDYNYIVSANNKKLSEKHGKNQYDLTYILKVGEYDIAWEDGISYLFARDEYNLFLKHGDTYTEYFSWVIRADNKLNSINTMRIESKEYVESIQSSDDKFFIKIVRQI